MLEYILKTPRIVKKSIAIFVDSLVIAIAFFSALAIRYDSAFFLYSWSYWLICFLLIPVSVFVFYKLGIYRAILRFIDFGVIKTISIGSAISTLFILVISFLSQFNIPRTAIFVYFFLLICLTVGIRLLFRMILNLEKEEKTAIVIYGAGDTGRQLLTMLNQFEGYNVVAFVDDNRKLHKLTLHGVQVYSLSELSKLVKSKNVKQILLAMPSISITRRKEIIHNLSTLPCEIMSVPSMEDILTGRELLTSLNKISTDDLLGRDPISPIDELLEENIVGKTVLVTGAGGSIGSELCRQIVKQNPTKLVLFEISEFNLYEIESELRKYIKQSNLSVQPIPIIGTIQNKSHLNEIMKIFKIDTIYHAAAYKHVPLVEYNIVEGCKNNILGTLNCALAAIENRIETFVLISTDKAVRPTNIMGATKRVAELILQALAKQQSDTRFCMVRFGNVLGSSGSVVPLFRKQIESGGPITLTHPDITRYFMTIPEAAQLVIQAGSMGEGGDVFVLDMGKSVKIIDLAKRMIELSGLKEKSIQNPNGDIEIKITGLRPGEKLYEELLISDNVQHTKHPRIMKAQEIMLDWKELEKVLFELEQYCLNYNTKEIRELLLKLPTGFNPKDNIVDLITLENSLIKD